MEDEVARREVWNGKIAVCFTLDEKEFDDSLGKEHPEPFYVSASCVLYSKTMRSLSAFVHQSQCVIRYRIGRILVGMPP